MHFDYKIIIYNENTVWLIFIFSPIARPILYLIGYIFDGSFFHLLRNPYEFVFDFLPNFLISLSFVFSLALFNAIFGYSPILMLRNSVDRRRLDASLKQSTPDHQKLNTLSNQSEFQASLKTLAEDTAIDSVDAKVARDRVSLYNSNQLLSFYALESRKTATRIQTFARVFLFVGTVIAGFGLGFFYYFNVYFVKTPEFTSKHILLQSGDNKSVKDSESKQDITDKVLIRIPGIAILFFIEFIALFFLRLFKSTMDEYRLYDEIARSRETNLIALKLSFERGDSSDVKSIIETSRLFSTIGRLAQGETTEFIESRKLQKDEIVLLEGMIDVLKKTCRKRSSKREKLTMVLNFSYFL